MKFLTVSGIGFAVIGIVFALMYYYLRVDRELSRKLADAEIRKICQAGELTFVADHRGVAKGYRNKYTWKVVVSLLSPRDQVIEIAPLGRISFRRHLPVEKTLLFDFIRDENGLKLTGIRE